jgi:hypothetical protein
MENKEKKNNEEILSLPLFPKQALDQLGKLRWEKL